MKTILIITCSYDKTVDYILSKYRNQFNYFRFDVDHFGQYQINITESGWRIIGNNDIIKQADVQSIYYRKPTLPDTSGFDSEFRRIINSDIIAIVDGIVNSFDGVVLTKPQILRKVENKVFQLLYAQKNNITIPKSFIGNNTDFNKIDACKIIKPISVGKINSSNGFSIIQTNIMHKDDKYDNIELTPIYVQEYISKAYEVRITVVDNDFYPVKISSDNLIDWRCGDNNAYELIEIPQQIKKQIKRLMYDFDLKFGAIDYIVDPNGKWYFLEINPNGQWQWLEIELNLKISNSILHLLLGE